MTVPVSLNTISNLQDTTTAQTNINANSAAITGGFSTALNVTGDQMKGNLDMNSNQILNLPSPATANSPVRLVDVTSSSQIASVPPVGTSGAVVPLLNTNNTWTGVQTFTNLNLSGQKQVSANYNISSADNGQQLGLGNGTSYFTVTFPAANTLNNGFFVYLTNTDNGSGRAKTLVIPAHSNRFLWPTQSMWVFVVGGQWQFTDPGRWHPDPGTMPNIYVNHASGNDANDGLESTTGALATINQAWLNIKYFFDCAGSAATIQLASETFNENFTTIGRLTGTHAVTIVGQPTTPSAVVWKPVATTGSYACTAHDSTYIIVNGITFQGSAPGQSALAASQLALVGHSNCVFGNGFTGGGSHINIGAAGIVTFEGGTYTIAGPNFGYHIVLEAPSHYYLFGAPTVVSCPNVMNFTAFLSVQGPATFLSENITFSGSGAGTSSTGLVYNVVDNGYAQLNGVTMPGSTSGVSSAGGIVTA